ncbi:MAG: ABC transporter permease [Chlorobi bacterium]|nr:ABC transporter permease [Chlorobiota bacterium]
MNLELFIARKIQSGGLTGKKLAGPVTKVATLGIILGMVVMILSLAIGFGFKKEIREKITGFGAHIQIMNYDYNQSYETNPIAPDSSLIKAIENVTGVKHVQKFATKPGMIKTNDAIQGIVLKGAGTDFDWSFFKTILTEGDTLSISDSVRSNDILISRKLAQMLHLSLGDDLRMYFLQKNKIAPRARKFRIHGIFDSNLPEFDMIYAIVDIKQVQRLNNWSPAQVSGLEIWINNFNDIEKVGNEVRSVASAFIGNNGTMLRTRTILDMQPQIFGWLDLLDMNVLVILVLIMIVAGFNMVSGLLILILERTNMIGILKALGIQNGSLRKIFIYLATFIVGRGLIWGNFIGVTLSLIQKYTGIIKLDPENYYLETVPIQLSFLHLLILNAVTIIITTLMMFGPSYLASKISPVKAIRFD